MSVDAQIAIWLHVTLAICSMFCGISILVLVKVIGGLQARITIMNEQLFVHGKVISPKDNSREGAPRYDA